MATVTAERPNRVLIASICLALAVVATALAVRFLVIEGSMAQACIAAAPPSWCAARNSLVQFFRAEGFGYAALAAGILAHLFGGRPMAIVALIVGAAGLVLYNTGLASVAVLLGLLRLVRR
jgi:hypothetical protein